MHGNLVRAFGLAVIALALGSARAEDGTAAAAATPPPEAAAPQAVAAASAPAQPQQHCWREYHVGSNFPVTHCESDNSETEAERQRRLGEWHNSLTRANQSAKPPTAKTGP